MRWQLQGKPPEHSGRPTKQRVGSKGRQNEAQPLVAVDPGLLVAGLKQLVVLRVADDNRVPAHLWGCDSEPGHCLEMRQTDKHRSGAAWPLPEQARKRGDAAPTVATDDLAVP